MSPEDELMTLIFAFMNSGLVPLQVSCLAAPLIFVYGLLVALLTRWRAVLASLIPALLAGALLSTQMIGKPLVAGLRDGSLSSAEVQIDRALFLVVFAVTSIIWFVAIGSVVTLTRAVATRALARGTLSKPDELSG